MATPEGINPAVEAAKQKFLTHLDKAEGKIEGEEFNGKEFLQDVYGVIDLGIQNHPEIKDTLPLLGRAFTTEILNHALPDLLTQDKAGDREGVVKSVKALKLIEAEKTDPEIDQIVSGFTNLYPEIEEEPVQSQSIVRVPEKVERPPLPIRFTSETKASPHHPNRNEDTISISNKKPIAVLCDGMGGVADGQRASQAASLYLTDRLESFDDSVLTGRIPDLSTLGSFMQQALVDASEHVGRQSRGGTTAVVAKFYQVGDKLYVAIGWVGDSRAYQLSGGRDYVRRLNRLTEDDSTASPETLAKFDDVLTWKDYLRFSKKEKDLWEERNVITQSLGSERAVRPHVAIFEVKEGDRIILTTDGVHDNLTRSQIEKIARESQNPAYDLLDQSYVNSVRGPNNKGEYPNPRIKADDISVIVAEVGEKKHGAEIASEQSRPGWKRFIDAINPWGRPRVQVVARETSTPLSNSVSLTTAPEAKVPVEEPVTQTPEPEDEGKREFAKIPREAILAAIPTHAPMPVSEALALYRSGNLPPNLEGLKGGLEYIRQAYPLEVIEGYLIHRGEPKIVAVVGANENMLSLLQEDGEILEIVKPDSELHREAKIVRVEGKSNPFYEDGQESMGDRWFDVPILNSDRFIPLPLPYSPQTIALQWYTHHFMGQIDTEGFKNIKQKLEGEGWVVRDDMNAWGVDGNGQPWLRDYTAVQRKGNEQQNTSTPDSTIPAEKREEVQEIVSGLRDTLSEYRSTEESLDLDTEERTKKLEDIRARFADYEARLSEVLGLEGEESNEAVTEARNEYHSLHRVDVSNVLWDSLIQENLEEVGSMLRKLYAGSTPEVRSALENLLEGYADPQGGQNGDENMANFYNQLDVAAQVPEEVLEGLKHSIAAANDFRNQFLDSLSSQDLEAIVKIFRERNKAMVEDFKLASAQTRKVGDYERELASKAGLEIFYDRN